MAVGGTFDDVAMSKPFRTWEIDQTWLFPPSLHEFVPEDHLAHFIRDVVREELDLSELYAGYTSERGQPPYHPAMMTALLTYGYSRGVYSSRRLERACVERLDFMAVTGMSKPDHSTISEFRKRHREALAGLFVQILQLCREAGLVKLGHVALDGTKVKANASKHKAMSYKRMKEAEPVLAAEVEEWLKKAESTDADEDDEHGKGRRGDELPDWVKSKQKKLEKIREAKARLEAEAKAEAERLAAERAEEERKRGKPFRGKGPRKLEGIPEDKAQKNFTDPESRIMKTANGFEQAYNMQLAVDAESQVIVAYDVTDRQNDVDELLPMVDQIEANLGELPDELSADNGYLSEANLQGLEDRGVEGYVATGRQKHGEKSATNDLRQKPLTKAMRAKLKRGGHRSRYRLRKQSVEPVNGQIKWARGFDTFLTRGIESVRAEGGLVAAVHNLLKLAGSRGYRAVLA